MTNKLQNLLRRLLYPLFKDLVTKYSSEIDVSEELLMHNSDHIDFINKLKRAMVYKIADTLIKEKRVIFYEQDNIKMMCRKYGATLRIF